MDKNNIVNKVASGLRRMYREPDYLIFNNVQGNGTWDEKTICGIPVIHIDCLLNWQPISDTECPFIPAYTKEGFANEDSSLQFAKGYYEG